MKTPREYQSESVTKARYKNLLIGDDCGLGKTFTSILIAHTYGSRRTLVVCPRSIFPQWTEEILEVEPDAQVTSMGDLLPVWWHTDGKPPEGWFLIHYEGARILVSDLTQYVWDVVIVDEAHRIKNRNAKGTNAIKHIPSVRRIGLSGTPMEKSPADLWSIANWLYPEQYTSYWRWYNTFVEEVRYGPGKQWRKIKGIKDVEKLAKTISPWYVRHTKEQVEPDLPPLTRVIVPINLLPYQREAYNEVKNANDVIVTINGKPRMIDNPLSEIETLQQIASFPRSLDPSWLGASAKMEWIFDWLNDNPNESVIVFTKYRATAEYLAKELPEADLIIGGVQPRKHDKPLIVATIQMAGEGIDLPEIDYSIFVDQMWSSIKMSQAADRIHRMNITKPKFSYVLQAIDTVDLLIEKALKLKWSENEMLDNAIHEGMIHDRRA